MHECDVVVAADNVPQGGQPLLYALDLDRVREGVADVLEFLVCCCGWEEEAVFVALRPLVFLLSFFSCLLLQ